MFIVMSHHLCKPGQSAVAQQRIDKNGSAMTAEPGFLYRYRVENKAKPDVVSTVTVWNAESDYTGFRDRRAARGGMEGEMPWDRIEGESYEVQTTHGNAPK
jgi:heme-degrading monooxygenase HmoA